MLSQIDFSPSSMSIIFGGRDQIVHQEQEAG